MRSSSRSITGAPVFLPPKAPFLLDSVVCIRSIFMNLQRGFFPTNPLHQSPPDHHDLAACMHVSPRHARHLQACTAPPGRCAALFFSHCGSSDRQALSGGCVGCICKAGGNGPSSVTTGCLPVKVPKEEDLHLALNVHHVIQTSAAENHEKRHQGKRVSCEPIELGARRNPASSAGCKTRIRGSARW